MVISKVFPGSGSNGVNPDFTPPGSKPRPTPPGSGSKILPGFLPRRGRGLIFCRGLNPAGVGVVNIPGVISPPGSGFNFLPGFYPRRGRGQIFCSGF